MAVRKKDPEKKRADIMDKAMKLFLTKGFEATSTSDICFAAKLTKPSLYHYFESKNHLLFSVHMRAIQNILKPYLEQVGLIEESDARIEAIVRGFTRLVCTHPELRFILTGSLSIRDKYYAGIRVEWKKHYHLLRDNISKLQSEGKIDRTMKPSHTALLLLGMITWITFWLDYRKKDSIEEVVDLTTRLALRAIGLRSPSYQE